MGGRPSAKSLTGRLGGAATAATATAPIAASATTPSAPSATRAANLKRAGPSLGGSLPPAAIGGVGSGAQFERPGEDAGLAAKRQRQQRFSAAGIVTGGSDRGASTVAPPPVSAELAGYAWYRPPPYSWRSLVLPASTDHGADGRNYADGGGWGRCDDMCPAGEAHERLHIAPNTNAHELDNETGRPKPEWLVTMFHRNDAARVWKPEDIRSVSALAASVEHLMSVVLQREFCTRSGEACPAISSGSGIINTSGWEDDALAPPLVQTAAFVTNRLRQVRQEVTMQQDSLSLDARQVALDLLETCTRFHIMIEHRLCELGVRNLPLDDVKFDSKMNMQMW